MGESTWLYVPVGRSGLQSLVDADDYARITQYRWNVSRRPGGVIYAVRRWFDDGHYRAQYMHSLITGWPLVDHKNHDGLDNRRTNLRLATHTQNMGNQRAQSGAITSRFKGVCWSKRDRKWGVQIHLGRRHWYVGQFDDETLAAQAYDDAARICYGEFACLNFPDVTEVQWDDRFRDRLQRLRLGTRPDGRRVDGARRH